MSIGDEHAVLILGAGVSEPFGLPLGGDLIGQIAEQIKSEKARLFHKASDRFGTRRKYEDAAHAVAQAASYANDFSGFPIFGTEAAQWISDGRLDIDAFISGTNKLERLRELLTNNTSETIDDFIAQNGSTAELAKRCLATMLYKCCYDFPSATGVNECRLKAFEQREALKERGVRDGKMLRDRNWIHLLINILRHRIFNPPNGEQLALGDRRKLSIITFNYDTVLERVFDLQFANTERALNPWKDYIEILHVYGCVGDMPQSDSRPPHTIASWAKGIHVVNEGTVSEAVTQARFRAKHAIKHAAEIFAVGFSFSRPNCELLGLNERAYEGGRNTKITYCNFNGNPGLRRAVKRYEQVEELSPLPTIRGTRARVDIEETWSERIDQNMGVDDWIRAGYLGDLPG